MLAWRKHLGNTSAIREEVPIPRAPANGFLVKILAAGVCHSDCALLAATAKLPNFDEKYTLGHEGCGEIVEIGSEVTDSSFKKGDLVAVLAVPGCGQPSCLECRNDLPQLCKNAACYGIGQDGSFASYIAINQRAVIPVPNGVTPAQAAVATDACLTAYHAVKRVADVKSGDCVLIFGLGGLGFNALQIVLSIGARLLVVDKRPEVLQEAVTFGVAKEDVAPLGEDVVQWIESRGLVVDAVIDFVGMNETYTASQHLLRPGGKIVGVGLLGTELKIDNSLCTRKKLSILFSYGGIAEDVVDCLQMIQKGTLKPQVETTDMDNFPQVIQDLHEGRFKGRMALIPKL